MEPLRFVKRKLIHPDTGKPVTVLIPVYGPPDAKAIQTSMRDRRKRHLDRPSRTPLRGEPTSR